MAPEDLTQVRIGENQSTFREANEKIERAAERFGLDDRIPFICECADRSCTAIVRLDPGTYEVIRRDPRRFFNVRGHEALSVENGAGVVVDERDDYTVVEKIGIAGEVAAENVEGQRR
jgi:hypothetical protein